MSTLDQVLDSALTLPPEQQQMLISILRKRYAEAQRDEIAVEAKKSLSDYRAGKFRPQPVGDIIDDLRRSLDEPEE